MTISMYQASVPRIVNMLTNLDHLLDKALVHIESKKWNEAALTQFRLYPDMLPMTRQVQIACDTAKGVVARLAEVDIPAYEDNEVSFADLKQRIAKTMAFINGFGPAQIDGTEDKEITFPAGPGKTRTMKGQDYLTGWMLPNMYFLITTAYTILRHNGVEVGKIDYLLGAQG